MACSSTGNVISGSKLITQLHVQSVTLQKQSMRIQTTGQDLDLVRTFRITASRLTRFFTCNQRLSSTVVSSRAHCFLATVHQMTLIRIVQGNVIHNFPIRCADSSKKWSKSLQYKGYHNFKSQNAMIQQDKSNFKSPSWLKRIQHFRTDTLT